MHGIDELLGLLEAQQTLLTRLLGLTREERDCLLDSRLDRLEAIVAEQTALLATQQQLSNRISLALTHLADALHIDGRITLARVAETLTGPAAARVTAFYRAITSLTETVQREGRTNWHLSQQALKYVDFTLKLIGRTQSDSKLYAPGAQAASRPAVQLWLDRSA
jgi:hypothetical protein